MIIATIRCELYVDFQHHTNDDNTFNKKLLKLRKIGHMEDHRLNYFFVQRETVRGGAPPYRDNLIGRASSGMDRNQPA